MTCLGKLSPPRIPSFIRRQGRITPGQQYALENLWDKYCLNPETTCNFEQVFNRKAPLMVEIGFGNGECLAEMAAANPDVDYIGIEVHKSGVGHLMLKLEQNKTTNVRIFCHDAVDILEQRIANDCLTGVHLFFPDPWPKKRHHKRRIVRPDFINLIAKKLQPEGHFHTATDWGNYAEDMLSVISECKSLSNTSLDNRYCERPDDRPITKFEQRGLQLGHGVWDLIFYKTGPSLKK
jgi:tRNA (guanine-N7-)-methyltransferase